MALLPSIPVPRVNLNLNLRQKVWSPYGPRPRRSARVVKAWMGALAVVALILFYLNTRPRDSARDYATLLVHGHGRPRQAQGAGVGAGAGAAAAAAAGAKAMGD